MNPIAYLTKNLELLKNIDTGLYYRLERADPSELEFCQTEKNELNLKRSYESEIFYYHSTVDAQQEANQWFRTLDLNKTIVLFVYGIGLGYYYKAAKDWLKDDPNRELVFLEEDAGVIYRLLETETGYEILQDHQVHLIYYEDITREKIAFNELSWNYVLCPFVMTALHLYEEVNPTGFLELKNRISFDIVEKNNIVDEYLQYGIPFFRNFYPNLLELPHANFGNKLFNRFKNQPAIICGAGPSLNKNITLLKSLQERALLFAGSSALPALLSHDLIPHFGAAIDPNEAQLSRVVSSQGYDIPFFYRNRLFHSALQCITSTRLYLTGAGGYDISDWFEKELNIEGEILDEGNNVINFCIAIAYALGCNPIILVGVDLSFSDTGHYAEGVVSRLNLKDEEKNETLFDFQPVLKQDIYGNQVCTYWKWIFESEWISQFSKDHPDTIFINSTEGGLGFNSIPNLPLEEASHLYLNNSRNLYDEVKKNIEKEALGHIDKKTILDLLHQFKHSLKRCITLFDSLQKELTALKTHLDQKIEVSESLETKETILIEMEIEEEIAYTYLLSGFNLICLRVKGREIKNIQSSKKKSILSDKQTKMLLLQQQRIQFLKDTARVNITLIDYAINPTKSGQ